MKKKWMIVVDSNPIRGWKLTSRYRTKLGARFFLGVFKMLYVVFRSPSYNYRIVKETE